MPHSKPIPKPASKPEPPPTVSARWLLIAGSIAIAGAGLCAWLTLCLLFWQGSWQLLYHPTATITRTPASAGLAFDSVAFATTEAGEPRLKGWWIPAPPNAKYSRFTVLYLHSQTGNIGDAIDALAALHKLDLNVLAFDYRGYGQSQPTHPSEANLRQDADWALAYLTATRHLTAASIIVDGNELGANLALEVAAAHPELAGVALESPLDSPVETLFRDPRAHLVPARLLVSDRYDAEAAATRLRIPSLWIAEATSSPAASSSPIGYDRVASSKMLVWVSTGAKQQFEDAYTRWLDGLPSRERTATTNPGAPPI